MIIQRTTINRRAALRTESDAGCRVAYIQSSQLPAVDKQIQLVCTTHGTKIIGFLPQFMYTYLIDMAFQILRLLVDEADAVLLLLPHPVIMLTANTPAPASAITFLVFIILFSSSKVFVFVFS